MFSYLFIYLDVVPFLLTFNPDANPLILLKFVWPFETLFIKCSKFRSSYPEVFFKKGTLRNFAKFTGKHVCQSLCFNKVAGLRSANLFKKILSHRCFPVNFAKFLRTSFLQNTSGRLLLNKVIKKKLDYFLEFLLRNVKPGLSPLLKITS